jgi:mRNA-decapping enzyme subunit 2
MADTHFSRMSLADWLDDLSVRFLINLPESELSSVPRLCFHVEEAQWIYEDFIRPGAAAGGNPLPSLNLREFLKYLFQHCPLTSNFSDAQHIAAFEEFMAYKVRVPVRGAILMDRDMEKVVLVRGWKKGSSWSFPRGKINKDEADLACAIREVYEETGYDIRQQGLVPEGGDGAVKHIDVTMREQNVRLFVFRGVPEDTPFEPQTRKEISKIQWYQIKDLPGFKNQKKAHQHAEQAAQANRFYMVAPFLGPLKKWIAAQKRNDALRAAQEAAPGNNIPPAAVEALEEETDTAVEEPAVGGVAADDRTEVSSHPKLLCGHVMRKVVLVGFRERSRLESPFAPGGQY